MRGASESGRAGPRRSSDTSQTREKPPVYKTVSKSSKLSNHKGKLGSMLRVYVLWCHHAHCSKSILLESIMGLTCLFLERHKTCDVKTATKGKTSGTPPSGKVKADSGKTRADSGKVKTDSGKTKGDSGKVKSDSGKVKAEPVKVKADPAASKASTESKKTVNARALSHTMQEGGQKAQSGKGISVLSKFLDLGARQGGPRGSSQTRKPKRVASHGAKRSDSVEIHSPEGPAIGGRRGFSASRQSRGECG